MNGLTKTSHTRDHEDKADLSASLYSQLTLSWASELFTAKHHLISSHPDEKKRIISNTKADNMFWSRSRVSAKETTDKWLAPAIINQNSVVYKKKKIIIS